jgi:hypothetical protein
MSTTPRTTSGGLNTIQDLIQTAPNTVMEKGVFSIVEWVREYGDYYGQIDVAYLDPEKSGGLTDAPYIIFERCRDGIPRLVFSVWSLDDSIKERIIAADMTKGVDIGKLVEEHNAKRREEIEAAGKEMLAEAGDVVAHALSNPKTSYTFPNTDGDVVKLDDQFGIVKKNGQSI